MKDIQLKIDLKFAQIDELDADDRALVEKAVEATGRSYAKYSNFNVGAALRLANGEIILGANQENAVFTVGLCAERTAIFAAQVKYPDQCERSHAPAGQSLWLVPSGHVRGGGTLRTAHAHPPLWHRRSLYRQQRQGLVAALLRRREHALTLFRRSCRFRRPPYGRHRGIILLRLSLCRCRICRPD